MRARSLVSLAALALAGTMLAAGSGQAAPARTSTDPVIPSDLPRTARPAHYAIAIVPDLARLRFTGEVAIDLDVVQQTGALVLNAAELEIGRASLQSANGGAPVALAVSYDPARQTVRFAAPAPLAPGRYRLTATYSGKINTQANGLFVLDYKDPAGADTRALFTQFEAPDARRFAPMFDEPIYKATFDLSATVPAAQMAVSNMPVARETDLGDGRKQVTFRTSPKMSSYLLFFAAGAFERMSKQAEGGVEVGIVSPKGSGEQARLALDELAPLIPYYSAYFGQPYPLPKLDNVAGPGQSQFFGAMENWGAIFTFQRGLLNDPKITSPERRKYIVSTQNHEVAHQWFGDLVTMAWWDDLWLNEGFASWMETKATDHFHPDWFALLGRVNGREQAMGQDAFRTTHPVVQPIRTVEETNQAFDRITYDKGEAVIAMLEAYAGETVWRDGLRAYMAAHKFGNSRTADLWRAVEQAGAPGLTAIARDFTTQPGIPLVSVTAARCSAGRTTLTLTQGEFTRDRVGEPSALRWRVPVLAAIGTGEPVRKVITGGTATLALPGCGPAVLNAGQLGYYRTRYTPAMLAALTADLAHLKPIDQMGLVADQLELAGAGYQPLAPALDLLAALPADANPVVARAAIGHYAALYRTLGKDTASKARLAALAAAAWQPRLDALGLAPREGETLADANLRSALIASLGAMDDPAIIAAARARFAALADDPHALDGPLKTVWLGIVARNAAPADWDRLVQLATAAPSPVEQAETWALVGAARDPALARKALELALTDAPGKTTSASIITRVAYLHSAMAFDFVTANQAKVYTLVDTSGRARFIERVAGTADSPAMVTKLEAYAATLAPDARKPIDRALAIIRDRIATTPRVARETAAWLAKK
ncbi:MAG: M1 family metallopeptidase [Sphingomonadales bacterium]|nr:M1 family metallopeptidase [Sphingomonadales bacterium]MBU3991776.1 M1 family metallopeptidase [Alphaproteobacteria bacterium]